jgi:hypothetical protein
MGSRVVNRGGGGGDRIADADDLRQDAGDLCGSIELALALAAFGGEVAHEVFRRRRRECRRPPRGFWKSRERDFQRWRSH